MSITRLPAWRHAVGLYFAIVLPLSSVRAADFDVDLDRASSECEIRLTGEIFSGDLNKLKSKLPKDYTVGKAGPTMCLDSPGGDFVEGLKIAEFVAAGISTRLKEGALCGSACSWIFMAGTNNSTGGSELSRVMHARSTLAFHAPEIDREAMKKAGISPASDLDSVINAYSQAVAEIGEGVLKLAQRHTTYSTPTTLIQSSLLAEALIKTGKERLTIDTVGKAVRWEIEIQGVPSLAPRNRDDIALICRNALAQANDFWEWDYLYQAKVSGYIGYYDTKNRTLTAQVVLSNINSGACEVQLEFAEDMSAVRSIQAIVNLAYENSVVQEWFKSTARVSRDVVMPNYALVRPDTLLVDLSKNKGARVDPKGLANVGNPTWCAQQTAKSPDEMAICDNARLAAFDTLMEKYLAEKIAPLSATEKQKVQTEQRKWLQTRRACGTNVECLNRSYLDRIANVRAN